MTQSKRARRARAAAAAVSGTAALLLAGTAATACPSLAGTIGGIATHGGCGPLNCPPVDCATTDSTRGGGNSATMGSNDRGGPPFDISMVDFTFLPNTPVIKPNTLVRWTNNSPFFQHTSTRTGTWDSGVMNPQDNFDRTFGAADAGLAFDYVCSLHFGMEGIVNVAHFGDANLDERVNLTDFNILAANFGQSGRVWEQGDFNEDGTVNLNDFNLLAANFGREIQPAPPGTTIAFDFGGAGAFVPEPVGAVSLLALLPSILRRRRIAS
jgi:plastocyanin